MEIDVTELRDRSRRFRDLAEIQTDVKTKRALIDTADELEAKASEVERSRAEGSASDRTGINSSGG